MRTAPTFILIADSSHARLISHTAKRDAVLLRMNSRAAMKPTRELGTDKPGRAFDSAGRGRHAMEPRTTAQREAQKAFARRVSATVERTLTKAQFEKFIVVAAPRTLGDLRREFSDETSELISDEIRKDLYGLPDPEVIAHIRQSDIVIP